MEGAPLALTIGDAAGVGPELILRAGAELAQEGPLWVMGSVQVLQAAASSLRSRGVTVGFDSIRAVASPQEVQHLAPGVLAVLDVLELAGDSAPALPALDPYPWGQAVPAFGWLQYYALTRAIDLARAGLVSGIFTAPWHKARLADAGLPPTGHTEVLGERGGADQVVMMLAGDRLRVALATIHIPIAQVPGAIQVDSLLETLEILDRGLREQYKIPQPRIVVCGLNPHAGEGGVMGSEDVELIAPAIARARAQGLDVQGPYPADTLFPRVVAGREPADAVLAMYHDQGLVPLKTVHFGEAANITLGLPFVRTSVDHGTAYDIAGEGVADTGSFLYAGHLARILAKPSST